MFFQTQKISLILPLVLSMGGCMGDMPESDEVAVESADEALLPLTEVPFQTFEDPAGLGSAGSAARRVLISSAQQYKTIFGHAAPPSVSFEHGDKVIFYSAGTQPSTGFVASVTRVQRVGWFLRISTRLSGPGSDCLVSPAQTIPFVLAKVRAPGLTYQDFVDTERVHTECDSPSCEDVSCDPGTHCELQEVICVRAPCPPIPTCVEDTLNPCALLLCPANSTCVEVDGEATCQPIPNRDPCASFTCPAGRVCTAPADRPYCVRAR